ncbi:AMSH-like protease sst2 [Cytospora mali]|uniref:AMSH-like protease sst2 n=1 Tax=Cytospora mali TaxID=578113 RepID=A0A194VQJ9_CYTMA|nr:AMSH-like protease sst2 [Valsa mali]
MDTAWTLPDRPMSITEISEQADKFQFNSLIPLKSWLRASDTLLRQGNTYVREGNLTQAYLILFRYSTLVIQHLPRHPDSRTPEGKKLLKPLNARCGKVLETLNQLKPQINAAYDEWVKIHASQRDPSTELEGEKSPYEKLAARDPALSWNPNVRAKLLDAGENQDLAVDLAKQEIRRRDAARRATRQAGISEEEEQERRGAGLWDNWDTPGPRQGRHGRDDADDIRRNMDAARRRLDETEQAGRPPSSEGYSSRPINYSFYDRPPSYQYPSISRSSAPQYDSSIGGSYDPRPLPPPSRPAKELLSHPQYRTELAPPRPNKEPMYSTYNVPSPTGLSQPPELPPKPMDAKERYTFRPAAYLENGTPIRPIFLPSMLREEFLRVAAPNTRKGLEMCGILCGTSVNNALFVSCLVIPQQTCTSDTCETDNEESVIEFCTKEDLMVFGWIHTHPTQTCFMSSRDLHTQSGYQVMMPESIAIVCAPRSEPSYGIFRLTNPPGLDYILGCTQSSTFHQHGIDNLYTDASYPPGHVYHSSQLDFQIEDLRSPHRK